VIRTFAWAIVILTRGGPTPPVELAKSVECRRAATPIKLDGVLSEEAWTRAQAVDTFASRGNKPRTRTEVRFAWDDNYLYFSAELEDHDLYADVIQRNGMTWTNDVIELFLKPSTQKLGYYEFQVNPLNTPLELYFPSRGAGGYQRFAPITRLGMETAVKLDGTLNRWEDDDRGWTAEWRIPWSAFFAAGGRPKPGDMWRFAACRYDYSKDFEHEELSSTSDPGFHTYESYAELRFVQAGK